MAEFTVRVELHGATAEHYELLHAYMQNQGFSRDVEGVDASGNKGVWRLPTGEYTYNSELSASDIRNIVKTIGDSVKPGAWVLVTKSADRSWNTNKIQSL